MTEQEYIQRVESYARVQEIFLVSLYDQIESLKTFVGKKKKMEILSLNSLQSLVEIMLRRIDDLMKDLKK